MIVAAHLREGMALRIDKQIYKVLEAECQAGAGQAGGMVKTKPPTGQSAEAHGNARVISYFWGTGVNRKPCSEGSPAGRPNPAICPTTLIPLASPRCMESAGTNVLRS